MISTRSDERDWYSLPARSLWTALHDASLVRIVSDASSALVTLEFLSVHLQRHHALSGDLRFLFAFRDVLSLAARQTVAYPPFEYREGESGPEQVRRRAQEWHPVWRAESVAWPAFEAALDEQSSLDVTEAAVATGESGVIVTLEGNFDSDVWTYMDIRARGLSIGRTDGQTFDLDAFAAMGDSYWEAFAGLSP